MSETTNSSALIGVVMQCLGGRYGRERIDLPLALASLETPVVVFVIGEAVGALRSNSHAEYRWTKLWQLLIDMNVEVCVDTQQGLQESDIQQNLSLKPVIISTEQMIQRMASCRQLVYV